MEKHERRTYLQAQAIQKRYRQSDRAAKQTILAAASPKWPDPKRKYQAEVLLKPLRRIWFASDHWANG